MKRTISLILSLFMLLSCTACSENSPEPSQSSNINPTETQATGIVESPVEEETEGIPAPDLPEKDYGGAVFTCLTRGRYSGSFEEPFLSSDGLNGEIVNDAVYNRNLAVEEKFNVKFNIIENPDAANELQQLVLANDNSVDFVDTQAVSLATLSTKNILYNLLKIDHLNLEADYWSKTVMNDLQIDGKLYMMPSDISMSRLENAFFLYFNKELIKNYNLEDPYNLIDENRWTLDRYLDYLTTVSADLNGDGVYDSQDLYGILYEDADIHYILIGCGVNYTERNDEKGLVPTAYSEKTESIIEKCRTAYGGNNVITYQKIAAGVDTSGYDNLWEWARTLFENRQYLFLDLGMFELMNLRQMEDDFGLAPMPKYNEQQEYYYHRVNPEACIFSVPVSCPDFDRVGIILEYASYISHKDLLPAYYETTVKQKRIRDDKAVAVVDIVRRTARYQIADVYNLGISPILTNAFATGDLASKYAKQEKLVNKNIEKLYTAISALD